MSQRLPWFRMYVEFLNDPKMIALAFEDQRHFIGLLALKSDGALDMDIDDALLDRIVAQRLWIDHGVIRDVKKRLVAADLIDASWQPLAWEKRQMRSDTDPTGAERQRRFRKSKKQDALRNGSVTLPEGDIDRDTDKEEADASLSPSKSVAIPACPHADILSLFAERLPELPQPRKSLWTGSAASKALQARWKWLLTAKQEGGKPYATTTEEGLAWLARFFDYVNKSDFLTGRSGRWSADLGWLLKAENFAKVIAGNYENKDKT